MTRFSTCVIHGFVPGTTVTITCEADTTGAFSSTDVTVDADGSATHEACYFGYRGSPFWVTANGVTSPAITWQAVDRSVDLARAT